MTKQNICRLGWLWRRRFSRLVPLLTNSPKRFATFPNSWHLPIATENEAFTRETTNFIEQYRKPVEFRGKSAMQVRMSDMVGKLFLSKQMQLRTGVNQVTLSVSHLPQGLFFVTLQDYIKPTS